MSCTHAERLPSARRSSQGYPVQTLRLLGSCLVMAGFLINFALAARAQDDLEALEEQATRSAVSRVAPSVVQIQTVGGLERVGQGKGAMLAGTGPTTGVVLTDDGYIISSAFNFAQKPTSILVGLADGSRAPAKLVATDRNRQLALLKVDVVALKLGSLPVPEFVPEKDVKVGQWAVAIGRTYEGNQPNVSVGIVSATRRIWGKAIQTDAKVSPSNYGGPLVDIQGRVAGILVPLSQQQSSELAGVEWYDSGIGFAVSLEQVYKMLPVMKSGKDLYPGVMGISFKGDPLSGDATIATVRAGSPAAEAGLKAGDKLVEIEGQKVERQSQIKQVIGPRYAGEEITVAVLRDKERIEQKMTLVDKLEPYQHPFLGILPMRSPRSEADGVQVRYVYPGSAADKAGIKAGDIISSIAGLPVKRRDDMLESMAGLKFQQKTPVVLKRGSENLTVEATLTGIPDFIPEKLPAARAAGGAPAGARPEVGLLKDRKITEFENNYLMYVPDNYDPNVPHGILMWIHEPGGYKDDELLARWKAHCDANDLILVAPKSADANKWLPTEIGFLKKVLDKVIADYNVDRTRIVAHGYQGGGSQALQLAFQHRDLVRGVASVDGPVTSQPPENEPIYRQAFYLTNAAKAQRAAQIKAGIERLRQFKYPVTVKEQGDTASHLTPDQLTELMRWVDSLDRM